VQKDQRNPLFKEDQPWEPRFDNLYANVLYDAEDDVYKCWYSPFIRDGMVAQTPRDQYETVRYRVLDRTMGVCYAASEDGIAWRKPLMDICEFDGQLSNIVSVGPHGAGVFKDDHEPDPARRYKMLFKGDAMCVAFSADGLHWGEPVACPQIDAAGDTHNNALWVPELECYVGFTRLWGNGRRQVGRTESRDFLTWTKAEVVLEGVEPHLHTYAMPVFRYEGVYLGLVALFNSETDRTHTELTWSPDTTAWHRIDPGTPLIPNAAEEGAYDWGCVYPAAYPVVTDNEIRLYYGGSNGPHTNWRDGFFCLAVLGRDRFAGFEPESPDGPATVVTKPVRAHGDRLRLTADVQEGGSIMVAALDDEGNALARSETITTSVTDGRVTWEGAARIASADTVRIRFELNRAKLYAFGFGE
jgi:hypothetical protein